MRDFDKRPNKFDGSNGNQKQQVVRAFFEYPKTRTMVHYETGVPVKNIDRIVGQLKRGDLIEVIYMGTCEITKHPNVEYLSTDRNLFPVNPQQKFNF